MLGVLKHTKYNEKHNIIKLRTEIINTPLKYNLNFRHVDIFCSPEKCRRSFVGKLPKNSKNDFSTEN
jgi:hypothetical protein